MPLLLRPARATNSTFFKRSESELSVTNKEVNKMQEVDVMTEKEQATNMIDVYTDLLRIKQAADKDKEVNNQLRKAKAKLEALGVVVEDLVIE